jgi:hypothetical protein
VTGCPSELLLERHLRAARPEVDHHLAGCPRCRARVDWAESAAETFRREVLPATVDAVVERTRPGRLRLGPWRVPAAVAAAATVAWVALVLVPRSPPEGYLGPKGSGLTLSVFVRLPGGARPAADGEVVPADAALRFEVRAVRPCHLWLASLDGTGQVSRLHPASGAPVPVDGDALLPGGALLDGRGGPERIFAVCSQAPLAFEEIERAVTSASPPGEQAVRGLHALPGLPRDTLQATVLLEKRPTVP